MISEDWVRAQREKLIESLVQHGMWENNAEEVVKKFFGDEAIKNAKW